MAVEEFPVYPYHLKIPQRDRLDPRAIAVVYEQTTDTLFVHLYGEGRPAVSVLVDDDLYFRVDPETEEVVGVQMEYYLSHAVREHPELLIFADFADIPASLIERARAEIDRDRMQVSALDPIFKLLARA